MLACGRTLVISFCAAQMCSFLAAVTGVAAEYISQDGIDVSAFQCFLNYLLVGTVFGTALIWKTRNTQQPMLTVPLRQYALLSFVDVHANFLIVKAFQYTTITSISLLDSARCAFD